VKVVAVIRGLDHSDGGVGPEDSVVKPPFEACPAPLFSRGFPILPPCISGPQTISGLGVSGFGGLIGFDEDLDKYVFDAEVFEAVEDIELAVITESLGGNESSVFFFGRNGGEEGEISDKG
jgi:hypothetical protein